MADREKQIEELANVIAHSCIDLVESSCGECVSCVSCLATNLYKEGVTIQKWIPVTERLPEKDVKVLTWGVYGFSVNYRDRFSGKWRGVNGRPQWITHWMPLPEPPKGE